MTQTGMTQAGLLDLDARGLSALRDLTRKLEDTFRRYGYARVEPPAIDGSEALLERSGEDTRRRTYLFDDPQGRELCLRPEMTIPVCRLMLRRGLPASGVARLAYIGPVFRHEAPGPGRFRQFHQAGIELLGRGDPVAAEAEVVALAVDAAHAAGIETPLMILGDVRFFRVLLDHFVLPEHVKLTLKRDPSALRGRTPLDQTDLSPEQLALAESVAAIGRDKAVRLIQGFLSVADINRVGARGIDEIVERMIENAGARGQGLPRDVAERIDAFLRIEGEPREALEAIARFGHETGVPFTPILDEFRKRLDLLDAYGVDLDACMLGTGVKRDIDYYSGFIFEIAHDGEDDIWPLGGGGRYDHLMASLDPDADCPAIGFALGVERMLLATEPRLFDAPVTVETPVHAHIYANPPTPPQASVEAARALRAAGWRVSIDLGADGGLEVPVSTAPYIIIIETDAAAVSTVLIRSQADNKQYALPLDQLSAFAERSQ